MQQIICKDCNCPMESGYLYGTGTNKMVGVYINWHNGTFEKKWYGPKATGDKKLPVISYRCPRCKKIELYGDELMED